MKGRHDLGSQTIMETSAESADWDFGLQDRLSRSSPKTTNNGRPDGFQLTEQERGAGRHFIRFRISIIGGTTFDNVADIDLVTGELNGFNDFRQELPGPADKRESCFVFISSRPDRKSVV